MEHFDEVYFHLTRAIKSRTRREKAHGFKELCCISSKDDSADLLITMGIVETIFENAICFNAKIEMLSLECLEILSKRLAFYGNERFDLTLKFLKRLAFTSTSEDLFVQVLSTVQSMMKFLLERDLSTSVPLEDFCDLLWTVYTEVKSEICGVLFAMEYAVVLDQGLCNSEMKTFIMKMTGEVLASYGGEGVSTDEDIVDSLGSMMRSVMKKLRSSFQPDDMMMCLEFGRTLKLIFIPFLDNFIQNPSLESPDDNALSVAISSIESLFFCPDNQFKVSLAELIFPTSYKLFNVIESRPKEQRRVARTLLSNVLVFLCMKHLTADADQYWKQYFGKGLATVKYVDGCIPSFIKNHAEASWVFVFLHFFRIIYEEKSSFTPSLSNELCLAIGRHIIRLSEKGKITDAVLIKVLWLILAAHHDKTFFAQEKTMTEAVDRLIKHIESHHLDDIVTDHPSLIIWLFTSDAPKSFKLKMMAYWIEELDFSELIKNQDVIFELLMDNTEFIIEVVARIPPDLEKYSNYFSVMDTIYSKCDDQFKQSFSSTLWDNLSSILSKHSWSRTGDYPIFSSYLKLAIKFNSAIENSGKTLEIMNSMVAFFSQNNVIKPLWFDFVRELMKSKAKSSKFQDVNKYLKELTIPNMILLYEACLDHENDLFISGTALLVDVIRESVRYNFEYQGKQILISLRLIGQRLHVSTRTHEASVRLLSALLESPTARTVAVISPFELQDARKCFLTVVVEIFKAPTSNDLWACLNRITRVCRSIRIDRHVLLSFWVRLLAVWSYSSTTSCVEEIEFWRNWKRYYEHMSSQQRALLNDLSTKYNL